MEFVKVVPELNRGLHPVEAELTSRGGEGKTGESRGEAPDLLE